MYTVTTYYEPLYVESMGKWLPEHKTWTYETENDAKNAFDDLKRKENQYSYFLVRLGHYSELFRQHTILLEYYNFRPKNASQNIL